MSVFKLSTSCEEALERDGDYQTRDNDFKHCGYCGSMCPEELAKLIEEGKAIMGGSDWKYGYPHKFYVDVKNPEPEKLFEISYRASYDKDGNYHKEDVQYAKREYLHMKFYTNHLQLIDDETFKKVAPIISKACGITFDRDEKGLKYSAPYHGYQKSMHGY
jgi:NAD-dependent dihydropyrimidine dehydrogenase PreA subunit